MIIFELPSGSHHSKPNTSGTKKEYIKCFWGNTKIKVEIMDYLSNFYYSRHLLRTLFRMFTFPSPNGSEAFLHTMGKTARWFWRLVGTKQASESHSPSPEGVSESKPAKYKKWWSFVRSCVEQDCNTPPSSINEDGRRAFNGEGSSSLYVDGVDPEKHAIAVAAATAVVAEAALAAAKAAQAVVRLTSSRRCARAYGSGNGGRREESAAAVRIQAVFRGYLARKALRALKGLVRIQAIVRGYIVRKQNLGRQRSMQALVQTRARAGQACVLKSSHARSKSSMSDHFRNGTKSNSMDICDLDMKHLGSNFFDHWTDERLWEHYRKASIRSSCADDERRDRILEIDTRKAHYNFKRSNTICKSSDHYSASERNSYGFTTLGGSSSKNYSSSCSVDEGSQFSASSMTGRKSDCSRSSVSNCSNHPNYMSNTESSQAKVRSLSVPKQRLEIERSVSMRSYSCAVHDLDETRSSEQRTSAVYDNLTNKAYVCMDILGSW